MKIQQLYDRDIARRINPAVVVSEMEEYFINQEIDEYVFTPGITKNVYTFLNAIASKKEGKTGVWISGYYGSGKSHFIKYLFYCLNNKYRQKAIENFRESIKNIDPLDEPNMGMFAKLQRQLDALSVDEIIFNIDAVSDNQGEKDRITRVLLNRLNAFRGYNDTNIALALYLEKPLYEKGKFEDFKHKIRITFEEDWEENQINFSVMYLDKVIQIAQEFDPDLDIDSLKSKIKNRDQDYTIDFLVKELKDFLKDKNEDYRLIFMMDEVSQYIGSKTALLLNLQTIVEEVGSKVGNRVWIVCTAQQDLSNLISNTDSKTTGFGKILGRFETMISLESQDAAFITKKRVLEKNSDGLGILADYYKNNKGAIENQFVFDHDLYENYSDREDFTLTYPFIPYQFRLISDVFESFSNVGYVGEGVKNTERAILGTTHYTANLCRDNEVGYFVPFDLFFNELMDKNITHLARGILSRAYSIEEVKNEPFARRLVKVLFMISNLGETQSVNFPANIENLALLLMDSADTAKNEMQHKVQGVLDVLVTKNIIQVAEGKYRFLKEDEIEVANLIRNTPVTNEDRLHYIYEDIIKKLVNPQPVIQFGNKNFKCSINTDDKENISRGDFNVRFSIYDNTDLIQIAHSIPSNDMLVGISEWLRNDNDLKSKVLEYVRTQKYIRFNSASATGTRKETFNNFRETNLSLLNEIQIRFQNKFQHTSFISGNQVVSADEISGATPAARFQVMLNRHIAEVYRKHALSNGTATTNADLISNAKSKQKEAFKELTPAEEELNNKLNMMGEAPVVGDIVKQFEKAPHGWKDISTLDILLRLARQGLRRFEWKNEEIDLLAYAEKALNARERDAITVHKEKTHSQDEINSFIQAVNHYIFLETLIPSNCSDFKEAVEAFKKNLEPKLKNLNQLKDEHETLPFASHLKTYHHLLGEIYQTRNPEKLVESVMAQKEKLKQCRDNYKYVEEFIDNNIENYQKIRRFAEQNINNFASLDEMLTVSADELKEYLKTDTEPWDKFPQMRKVYKNLHEAVKNRLTTLKQEVTETYREILDELAAKQKELGIEEKNLTPDPDYMLQKIEKEKEIAQLEILLLKAKDFKAKNFKILEDYKSKQDAKKSGNDFVTSLDVSIAAEMPPTTIETPEQLDAYLNKLRERLMLKLAKNKKLFLN